MMLAAMVLTGCKDKNEVKEPAAGQEVMLQFCMNSEIDEPMSAAAPIRMLPGDMPGDPGKDDFIYPSNLYFILWVKTEGGTTMMAAVKETGLTKADWVSNGRGIYTLNNRSYKMVIPKQSENVQQLDGGVFHVFAFASTADLSSVGSISYITLTDEQKTKGYTITNTPTTLETLQALTYSVPAGITTADGKRDFFRSIYSTALSETSHNQMATSPTILLRHTASRLDINWECDEDIHAGGLTAGSTWTLALASNIMPTSFSLFQPGHNATGTASWSETITIDEGNRYNGRYVTYLPMPATPTFTVTSVGNKDKLDGANYSKSLPLSAGTNTNFATWMRALWTIK